MVCTLSRAVNLPLYSHLLRFTQLSRAWGCDEIGGVLILTRISILHLTLALTSATFGKQAHEERKQRTQDAAMIRGFQEVTAASSGAIFPSRDVVYFYIQSLYFRPLLKCVHIDILFLRVHLHFLVRTTSTPARLSRFVWQFSAKRRMRWGENKASLTGSVLSASASYRDEDLYDTLPHSQQPKAPVASFGPKPVLIGTGFGRSIRVGKGSAAAPEVSNAEDTSGPAFAPSVQSDFLVCAGKSVASNNNEGLDGSSEGILESSTMHESRVSLPSTPSAPDPTRKHAAQSSTSLHRSDSELEFIISDLREKISLQHRLDEEKRKAAQKHSRAASGGALDSSRSSGSNSESNSAHHPRKHLKNPVERVNGDQGGDHQKAATSSNLLRRQQHSANYVGRTAVESNAKLAVPAVTATSISASSSSSRMNLAPTSGNLHPNIRHDRDSHFEQDSTAYDDEGFQIKTHARKPTKSAGTNYGNQTLHNSPSVGTGVQRPLMHRSASALNPRKARIPKSKLERRSLDLELHQDENNHSDSEDSLLDGENPFLVQCSLSPVGPWMAEGPESGETSQPISSSPPSTARSTEDEFAGLSPRSRLLWFSHCADTESSEPSPSSFAQFRRCSSHSGLTRPSSAVLKGSVKANGSKTPIRCSSAKPSLQGKRESNESSSGAKSKSNASAGPKKRPQSGVSRTRLH